ncbi:hypothetical protein Rsub_03567 [Raphidocelis subcapitata]|uniref:DNA endonuclease activator Ctp1 C-terminal domain-containing protein n=1 Tax=Raphidocelis subcapitata TaxID=307507 RepID=A0A2V0P224_9CHLO|nr:hypothetical protein Rsub_03567 [Raphidocelis subcapitata]|eukprot:GBF91247.1 hypothetical protein Rsub_03567 [Raphidocelis subcapitata]
MSADADAWLARLQRTLVEGLNDGHAAMVSKDGRVRQLERENSRLAAEVAQLTKESSEARTLYAQAQQQHLTAATDCKRAQERARLLQAQLDAATTAAAAQHEQLRALREGAGAAAAAQQQEALRLQVQIGELRGQLDALRSETAAPSDAQAVAARLQQRLDEAQRDARELQRRNALMGEQLRAAKAGQEQAEEGRREVERAAVELRARLQQQQRQGSGGRRPCLECDALNRHIASLNKQFEEQFATQAAEARRLMEAAEANKEEKRRLRKEVVRLMRAQRLRDAEQLSLQGSEEQGTAGAASGGAATAAGAPRPAKRSKQVQQDQTQQQWQQQQEQQQQQQEQAAKEEDEVVDSEEEAAEGRLRQQRQEQQQRQQGAEEQPQQAAEAPTPRRADEGRQEVESDDPHVGGTQRRLSDATELQGATPPPAKRSDGESPDGSGSRGAANAAAPAQRGGGGGGGGGGGAGGLSDSVDQPPGGAVSPAGVSQPSPQGTPKVPPPRPGVSAATATAVTGRAQSSEPGTAAAAVAMSAPGQLPKRRLPGSTPQPLSAPAEPAGPQAGPAANQARLSSAPGASPSAPQQPRPWQQQLEARRGAPRPGFKFNEVVRGREARDALPAFDCHECRGVYEALRSWEQSQGGLADGALCQFRCREHGDAPAAAAGRAGAAGGQGGGGGGGSGGGGGRADQVLKHASRHRALHKRPETQEGYWDLGFMDSLDSRYVEQQAAARAAQAVRGAGAPAPPQDGFARQAPTFSGDSHF